MHASLFLILYIYIYIFFFFLCLFTPSLFLVSISFTQIDTKPISFYYPTSEEAPIITGTPMVSFFDGADAIVEAMASTTIVATQGVAAAQGVLVEALVPPHEPISAEESAHAEGVVIREFTLIFAEITTPLKGVIPARASQTKSTSSAIAPPVTSASNPFIALSQAVKDGYLLVVTLSSIPSFATRGPDADLSFDKGSEEVLEDLDDELIMRTQVFDSDEANDDEQRAQAMGMCPLSLLFLLFLLFLSLFSALLYLH